jgi:hypothetical protein
MWCIETFEVDDVDVRTGSDWKLGVELLDGGSGGVYSVNWYLSNTGPDAGPNNMPPTASTSSKIEVSLNTGDLDPKFTVGYGTGSAEQAFSIQTGGNTTTGYTLDAVGSPIVIEWVYDPPCSSGSCGDLTTVAEVAGAAFGGNTQNLGTWGEDAARFDGMWIVTDAQYYTYPQFVTDPEPHWYLEMGNPHLGVDGVTPQIGELIARVPAGMLADVGATAAEAVDVGLETRRVQGDTVVEVPSAVTESLDEIGDPDGGVILHITDFPYSVATLEVGGAAAEVEPSLTRLAGDDRILTSIAVSQQRFPVADTALAAVVARADLYPDALVGAPLAAHRTAPLLLTASQEMDTRVLAEIERVLPPGGTIYLLGGTVSLSEAVEDAVQAAGFEAVRLQGPTRFETAAEIGKLLAEDAGTIYLANGRNFPDALSAGAAAAATGGIILLTDGNVMPAATQEVFALFASDTERIAVGGAAAAADPAATQLVGANRFHTSALLAEYAFTDPTVFAVASGGNFPDGLTGGAHVGALGGPMLLVEAAAVPSEVMSYFDDTPTLRTGFVYGGELSITPSVFDVIEGMLTGQ